MIHLPPLSPAEVTAMLPPMGDTPPEDREFLGRTIQALADGRAAYVRALGDATGIDERPRRRSDQRAHGAADRRRRARQLVRAIATSCACTARAATARSRRSSRSSPRRSR